MNQKITKTRFFSFDPCEWIFVYEMNEKDVGILFKKIVAQLAANRVPEDSEAYPMFVRTEEYREKQRQRALRRWNNRNEQPQEPAEPQPVNPPSTNKRPPCPILPRTRKKEVDIGDVYDYCETAGISPTIGREWHEYMTFKGWQLTGQWQKALTGFAKNKNRK